MVINQYIFDIQVPKAMDTKAKGDASKPLLLALIYS